MLKQLPIWNTTLLSPNSIYKPYTTSIYYNVSPTTTTPSSTEPLKRRRSRQVSGEFTLCNARRRVRYDVEDDEDDGGWNNEEISMLESYSESRRGEALIVHAAIDEQDVEVIIFKGFSSSLSFATYPDPSRSILPARAVIKSIDRVKGPFDPSNIEYLEKGLTWEAFKIRLTAPAN